MPTTVLDGEIDRFLLLAPAQLIQGADAISTKSLFLGRRHRPHKPQSGHPVASCAKSPCS
jgi:hypothetical protein